MLNGLWSIFLSLLQLSPLLHQDKESQYAFLLNPSCCHPTVIIRSLLHTVRPPEPHHHSSRQQHIRISVLATQSTNNAYTVSCRYRKQHISWSTWRPCQRNLAECPSWHLIRSTPRSCCWVSPTNISSRSQSTLSFCPRKSDTCFSR